MTWIVLLCKHLCYTHYISCHSKRLQIVHSLAITFFLKIRNRLFNLKSEGLWVFVGKTFLSANDGKKLSVSDMDRNKYHESTLCPNKTCYCRKNNVATTGSEKKSAAPRSENIYFDSSWKQIFWLRKNPYHPHLKLNGWSLNSAHLLLF